MAETRTAFKAGVSSVIYTNTQKLIKGNTVRDKFLVMADSVLFFGDADVAGGFLAIDAGDGNVDIGFIKSAVPQGYYLKDDGTWSSITANTISGTFLFASGQGIDTSYSEEDDVLNIGVNNADIINYGNSATQHNFFGTAIYENQVNTYVTDKLITLNNGGSAGSAIGVGFEIFEGSGISGYFKTNAGRNGFSLKSPAATYFADLNTNLLTANRAYNLPDAAGTLMAGSLGDGVLAFGSSGAITGSADLTFNSSTKVLTVNGMLNGAGPIGFQIGGSTKFSVSSSLITNSLPMSFVAGSASAAPILLTSGALLTSPVTGSFEFLTDRLYFTKTTGTTRETIAFLSDLSSLSPGGSDNCIQYNFDSSFKGSTQFKWENANRYFKVDGSSTFGLATTVTPTAIVDIAKASASSASLRIRSIGTGSAPSSPNSGDIWQDGEFIYIQLDTGTFKFMLEPV